MIRPIVRSRKLGHRRALCIRSKEYPDPDEIERKHSISAAVAFGANLVSLLVPKGAALSHSIELAARIATMPPLAIQAIREAVRLGADVPLETALALERRLFERLFDSQDQKEGMAAFLDKRAPNYQGR